MENNSKFLAGFEKLIEENAADWIVSDSKDKNKEIAKALCECLAKRNAESVKKCARSSGGGMGMMICFALSMAENMKYCQEKIEKEYGAVFK